jgi:hypothetical protein
LSDFWNAAPKKDHFLETTFKPPSPDFDRVHPEPWIPGSERSSGGHHQLIFGVAAATCFVIGDWRTHRSTGAMMGGDPFSRLAPSLQK